MKKKVSCNHFWLVPTEWNQPKPEVWEGETCECGQNWCCPVCGYGNLVYPCECHKAKQKFYWLERSK